MITVENPGVGIVRKAAFKALMETPVTSDGALIPSVILKYFLDKQYHEVFHDDDLYSHLELNVILLLSSDEEFKAALNLKMKEIQNAAYKEMVELGQTLNEDDLL